MGFPVGYSELFLPRLLLYALTLLGLLRRLAAAALRLAGAAPDDGLAGAAALSAAAGHPLPDQRRDLIPSVSAMLIREILPVVRFDEIAGGEGEGPDSCAVCLYEFEGRQEIRRLRNCRHIFHRGCLDQWMDHDQRTCPLCRTPFVPSEMQEAFNERLWAAAGVPDYYSVGSYLGVVRRSRRGGGWGLGRDSWYDIETARCAGEVEEEGADDDRIGVAGFPAGVAE